MTFSYTQRALRQYISILTGQVELTGVDLQIADARWYNDIATVLGRGRPRQSRGVERWLRCIRLRPTKWRRSGGAWHRASRPPLMRSARRSSPMGLFPAKIEQIIAVAVAHVTQCPYCING